MDNVMNNDGGRTLQNEQLKAEREKAEREGQERDLRESLHAAWLQAGGLESEFEANFKQLRLAHIQAKTLAIADSARQEQRAIYRDF